MPEAPLGNLAPSEFLQRYWQKQPCLIRQALPGYDSGFDGNDLAGLACEPLAEARIVSGSWPEGQWDLQTGPFAESIFEEMGEKDWTLLVQDVEKHFPPLSELTDRFSFLPDWRLDDLMVSFAATGGSVGPHVDQYDVFLLQVSGRRHWEIATDFDPTLDPDAPLKILQSFTPTENWILEPGDMLYLPPGVAHHGVALDPCMTFSIGLRAPSIADLNLGLGEWLGDSADEGGRFSDPWLNTSPDRGEIDTAAFREFRTLMQQPLQDEDLFREFVGQFMSRYRMAHEPAPPPNLLTSQEIKQRLGGGATFYRNPWTRLNWFETMNEARLHVAGAGFDCSLSFARSLCGEEPINLAGTLSETELNLLVELLNSGHLLLS